MRESCQLERSREAARPALRRLRVLIVEDSLVIREFLTHIIQRDPRLEIAAVAASGEDALRRLESAAPDVISMDIRLPGIDGLETIRRIMARRPTPIVVVAANVDADDLGISINAMHAGALSVLEKPAQSSHDALEAFAERLCTQLAIMSQVKVITRHEAAPRPAAPPAPPALAPLSSAASAYEMIGIVASTGGPNALLRLLGDLERDFPLPILLVQHITSCFARAFVEWLGSVCPLRVVEARSGDAPAPGTVYVAPADHHLRVRRRRLWLSTDDLVCMQRPSGTVLLRSLAEDLGPAAVGIVLTGMGEDGAEGLRAVRAGQGYTIAEHESTAVVYGMPAAAVALGAARESLPLEHIAPRLRQLVRQPRGDHRP